jgi:hypothetical protein
MPRLPATEALNLDTVISRTRGWRLCSRTISQMKPRATAGLLPLAHHKPPALLGVEGDGMRLCVIVAVATVRPLFVLGKYPRKYPEPWQVGRWRRP